ncbi:sulfatase [Nitzschia inconspicua]|uniref:Sulfatase n=1 Tax=Nitzschia inconspicua TaxID=303405 RepID=A0A9K3KQD2_9STRA|nr:sulfatase [Nitzschia inconspicua]
MSNDGAAILVHFSQIRATTKHHHDVSNSKLFKIDTLELPSPISILDKTEHIMPISRLLHRSPSSLPNILIIITDQERAIQHWPESFSQQNLPSMERLKKHGMEFHQHYTNACMCSPSRATLLTSQFPVITGVNRTGSPGPPTALPTDIPNIATVMKQAGYKHIEWYGKWHLGGTPADYGFEGWQPPDAGNYLTINETLGGGDPNNDGRFLDEVCRFLNDHNAQQGEPFCVVVSFVNPHDVYVAQHQPALGYTTEDFQKVNVPLPTNLNEDPDRNNKPRAQGQMSYRYVTFDNTPQDYVSFYAYLHTMVDAQIGKLLGTLDRLDLTESTLIIRTADHGEQALSHSLVEKFYNCYEESIHIPLVISNPVAFPEAESTSELTSHVDLLPTLARLCSVQDTMPFAKHSWKGRDLTSILENPNMTVTSEEKSTCKSKEMQSLYPKSYIHFTYDDIECPGAPSTIRCIQTCDYKYAVYFTPDGSDADWELYCRNTDPLENNNLAGNPKYALLQVEMDQKLWHAMVDAGTLPQAFEWPPSSTMQSRGS